MEKKLIALVLLLATSGAIAQTPPKAAKTPIPQVRVSRGQSPMDGKHWVVFEFPAKSTYVNTFGVSVRPKLEVRCVQTEDQRSLLVNFMSGPLTTPNPDFAVLRVKMDDGEAIEHEWDALSDYETYRYWDDSYSDIVAGEHVSARSFVRALLAAKRVLIEFHPLMRRTLEIAEFDLRGFNRAFGGISECDAGIPTRTEVPIPRAQKPGANAEITSSDSEPVTSPPPLAPPLRVAIRVTSTPEGATAELLGDETMKCTTPCSVYTSVRGRRFIYFSAPGYYGESSEVDLDSGSSAVELPVVTLTPMKLTPLPLPTKNPKAPENKATAESIRAEEVAEEEGQFPMRAGEPTILLHLARRSTITPRKGRFRFA